MEIDDKLKNRLAGTAVVTVLAVIFLPMLFEDSVQKKGQVVSELGIPRKPQDSPLLTAAIVPDKSAEVVEKPKTVVPSASETAESIPNEAKKGTVEPETATLSPPEKESATVEEESPAAVKKKITKNAEEHEDFTVAEEKPKKPVKKAAKSELPILAEEQGDKKAEPKTLPSLDSATEKRRWMIQVVSLTDEAKANAFRDKLRAQGFPATIDSKWLKGKGRVYRLKVGPELDAEKAKAMKNKINQLNNVNSIAIAE